MTELIVSMPMRKINRKVHGATLIYAMGAVLLLSATVGMILMYSRAGAISEAGIRSLNTGKDFSELCEESVINLLSTGRASMDIPARIAQITSAWTSSGPFRKTTVNVAGWLKCSDTNSWAGGQIKPCYECSFEPDTTLNGTINIDPGQALTTTYYKVTSIHDTGQGRIHYETSIAIGK